MHKGDGRWILVDSFTDAESGKPRSLAYLEEIGFNPASDVDLVIATHWHDDHIQGISEMVEKCQEANVATSAVMSDKVLMAFVLEERVVSSSASSGVDELHRVLKTLFARGEAPIWAKANLPLHPIPPGESPEVVALSPSDDALTRSLSLLIEEAKGRRSTLRRRFRAPEGPNGASLASVANIGNTSLLLGADLENSANDLAGWQAVCNHAAPHRKASLTKVPHHGSEGAHHGTYWELHIEDQPIAIVTPWIRGGRQLPTSDDLDRISATGARLFVTSQANASTVSDRAIRKVHSQRVTEVKGDGHVRARRSSTSEEWSIELFGDAYEYTGSV